MIKEGIAGEKIEKGDLVYLGKDGKIYNTHIKCDLCLKRIPRAEAFSLKRKKKPSKINKGCFDCMHKLSQAGDTIATMDTEAIVNGENK